MVTINSSLKRSLEIATILPQKIERKEEELRKKEEEAHREIMKLFIDAILVLKPVLKHIEKSYGRVEFMGIGCEFDEEKFPSPKGIFLGVLDRGNKWVFLTRAGLVAVGNRAVPSEELEEVDAFKARNGQVPQIIQALIEEPDRIIEEFAVRLHDHLHEFIRKGENRLEQLRGREREVEEKIKAIRRFLSK